MDPGLLFTTPGGGCPTSQNIPNIISAKLRRASQRTQGINLSTTLTSHLAPPSNLGHGFHKPSWSSPEVCPRSGQAIFAMRCCQVKPSNQEVFFSRNYTYDPGSTRVSRPQRPPSRPLLYFVGVSARLPGPTETRYSIPEGPVQKAPVPKFQQNISILIQDLQNFLTQGSPTSPNICISPIFSPFLFSVFFFGAQ